MPRMSLALAANLIYSQNRAHLMPSLRSGTEAKGAFRWACLQRFRAGRGSCIRDLGYQRLQERNNLYEIVQELLGLLRACGVDQAKIDFRHPRGAAFLESYAYVELAPPRNFKWDPDHPRLPEQLVPLVAKIRTDLDSFSLEEISALMFHGYTTIDHCLRRYQKNLMPPSPPPLRFTFGPGGLFENWDSPTAAEIDRAEQHLSISGSRSKMKRRLCRWWHWLCRLGKRA